MSEPDPQDWLVYGDLGCLQCQYNLRSQVGPLIRCPECGYVNDLTYPDQWQQKTIPIGVRKREHWPAQAVFFLLMTIIVWLILLSMVYPWPPSDAFIMALLIALGSTVLCVQAVVRWFKSCQRFTWALGVLAGLTASTIAFLISVPLTLNNLLGEGRVLAFALTLTAASIAGFILIHIVLKRGDRAGTQVYRHDWRGRRITEGFDTPQGKSPD